MHVQTLILKKRSKIINLQKQKKNDFFIVLNYLLNNFIRKGLGTKLTNKYNNFLLTLKFQCKIKLYALIYIITWRLISNFKLKKFKRKFKKEVYKIQKLNMVNSWKMGLRRLSIFIISKKFNKFINIFLMELFSVYHKRGNVYNQKYEHYAECSKSRFFKK